MLRPAVERMEGRVLLSTFTVTNTTDTAAMGSLRWAIGQSNGVAGPNTINFNIAPSGVQSIAITSALPAITVPVKIDGTTEPGYTTTPLIELNGAGAGKAVDGLDISAGASTVDGLAINRFTGEGINLSVVGGDAITADFIGIDPTGTIAEGNTLDGVLVRSSSNNNTISGNVISGNTGNAVYLNGSSAGGNLSTSGDLIAGNLLGLDVTGKVTLGNNHDGVYVQNAPMTTVGGTTAAARNIISGNGTGMELYDNSDGSVFEGNYIGTDITGSVALGNNASGGFFEDNVVFRGLSNSTIGGTAPGAGNVISGGSNYGIDCFVIGSSNLAIQGNLVGTDATGTRPLPNKSAGILISGPTNVTIGGTVAGARNVVSGNTGDGIQTRFGAAGLLIEGNFVGTAVNGFQPLGNGGDGVAVTSTGVSVGGTVAGAGNIIANNGTLAAFDKSGVVVTVPATPVLSNSIYNNKMLGIELQGGIAGGNDAQPAPVIASADSMNTTSTIVGSLTSAAGTYTLQFFSTPTLNASNNAEGQTLIGTASVTVVGTSANFTLTLPSGFTPGTYITATATDAAGNTSQFSAGSIGTGVGNGIGPPTLTASASGATVAAGQDVTDTFTISNPFSVSDDGVIFSDPIPTGTNFVSGMTSTGVPVTLSGGMATATIGTLPAGATVTVSIVLMATPVAVPSFTNLGTISSTTPPIQSGTITAAATTAVTASADLAVALTGPTTATQVGQNLTYLVTVINNGPSDATLVQLDDVLPAGVTLVSANASSGPAPTLSNGVVSDAYGDLANGASFTVTIIVTAGVASVPTATDTATVAATEPDPDLANNMASVSSDVTPLADVAVGIATSAPSVGVGGNLIYTVTVTNKGPSDASGVILNDVLPGTVMFVSATADSGPVPTESGGTVTDAIGALVAGGSVVITISVIPTGATPPSITDTANVGATEDDPNLMNNVATAMTNVFPVADLSINSQAVSPAPAIEGTLVTITILVANNGPSTATGVSLTENLPAGLTFVSGTADGGQVTANGGVVVAPIADLNAASTSLVTIVAMTTAVGPITVVSTVSSAVEDPMTGNNSATSTFQVVASADLSVTLTGNPGPIYDTDQLTYTAVVTNNGPSPATNVMFTDPLFPGARFVSVEANGVFGSLVNNTLVVQSLGTLAPGASETVVLVVVPTQASLVVDTATVSATEPDPNLANNSASFTTVVIVPQSLISFSSSSYVVNSTDGVAVITLFRTGYQEDDVTVHFSTVGGNGTPGADYSPVSETVDFPAGTTQVVVDVPILNNLFNNKNVVVDLQLDTPTGSGILEPGGGTSPSTALLTIIDVNPDLVGPTVTDLRLTGYVNSITAIEVDTSGHLDPKTASVAANYTITALGGFGKKGLPFGTVVPVSQVVYNPATGAVFLIPAIALPGNELFVVVVNGSGPGAVTDLAGNPLNSAVGVRPGSDYTLIIARGNDIVYHDNNNVAVTLKLTGPGTLDIDQFPDGQLQYLQVVGGVGGKTVVTATSKPLVRRSIIGSILGLGQFGSIRLKLTTPPFYVNSRPYPNLQTQVGPDTIDFLLPTPAPVKPTKSAAKLKAKATTSTHGHTVAVKEAAIAPTIGHPDVVMALAIAVPNPANQHHVPAAHKATSSKHKVNLTISASKHPHAAKAKLVQSGDHHGR